jgi:ribosomal protein S27E
MDTIELHPETIWNGTCPSCKAVIVTFDDSDPVVKCDICGKEFEAKFQ